MNEYVSEWAVSVCAARACVVPYMHICALRGLRYLHAYGRVCATYVCGRGTSYIAAVLVSARFALMCVRVSVRAR